MVINNHTTLEDDLLLLNSISLVRIEKGSHCYNKGTYKAVL